MSIVVAKRQGLGAKMRRLFGVGVDEPAAVLPSSSVKSDRPVVSASVAPQTVATFARGGKELRRRESIAALAAQRGAQVTIESSRRCHLQLASVRVTATTGQVHTALRTGMNLDDRVEREQALAAAVDRLARWNAPAPEPMPQRSRKAGAAERRRQARRAGESKADNVRRRLLEAAAERDVPVQMLSAQRALLTVDGVSYESSPGRLLNALRAGGKLDGDERKAVLVAQLRALVDAQGRPLPRSRPASARGMGRAASAPMPVPGARAPRASRSGGGSRRARPGSSDDFERAYRSVTRGSDD